MLHQTPSTPRPRPPNFSRSRSSQAPGQGGHTRKPSSLSVSSSSKAGTVVTSLLLGREEEERTSSASCSPTKRASDKNDNNNNDNNNNDTDKIPFPSNHSNNNNPPPPPYPTSPPASTSTSTSTTDDPAQLELLVGFLHDGANAEGLAHGLVAREGEGEGAEEDGGVISEEWVKERSREELDRLLIEADRVIREREKELGIAAAIGKSLLENNIALRTKHESLLASFPLHSPHPPPNQRRHRTRTPRPSLSNAPSWLTDNGEDEEAAREAEEREEGFSPSRQTTPTNSYGRSSSSARMMSRGGGGSGDQGWVFGRPSSRSSMGGGSSSSFSSTNNNNNNNTVPSSPPRSQRVSTLSSGGFPSSPTSSRHPARTPSLSASPQAILYLREQNTELALQLEQLQAETSDADHEGKKKLRKLEKEIGALRGNLERLNERNGELEERNGELEEKVSMRGEGAASGRGREGGRGDGGWGERRRLKREVEEEEEEERRRRRMGENGSLATVGIMNRYGGAGGRRTPSPTAHLSQQQPQPLPPFSSSQRSTCSSSNSSQSTLSPPASPRSRSISLLGPSLSLSLSVLSSPLRSNSTTTLSLTPVSTASSSTSGGGDASRPRTAAELALVSQLLGKIRELEQANEEMTVKREEMDRRIRRAKREGEVLEGVYDVLEGEVERAGLDVGERGREEAATTERRTPSRQTGAAGRKALDQRSKSPSTAAIQLDFFSTSPSSGSNLNVNVNNPTASFGSSSSPSSSSSTPHRRVVSPQQQRLSPSPNRTHHLPPPPPASPSSFSVASSSTTGSARFRSATGNRLMIESSKLRKKISSSTFLAFPPANGSPGPSAAAAGGPSSPTRRDRDRQHHLRESRTPSPTAIRFGQGGGGGGSPLKLRVDVRDEEDEEEMGMGSPSKKGRSNRRASRSWEDEAAAAAAAAGGGGEYEYEQGGQNEESDDEGLSGSSRRELTPRRKREIRLAAMPPSSLRSLGSWGKKGSTSRGRGGRTAAGGGGRQTLGSELGSQYGSGFFNHQPSEEREWEDDDASNSDGYSSSSDEGSPSHYLPSTSLVHHASSSELALRSVHLALTPTEDGLYLDTSTPILPPGSLVLSPPADSHTFDLLDQAVHQRPIRWADDDDDMYGTSRRLEPTRTRATTSVWDLVPSFWLPKQRDDPFETTIYPEPELSSLEEYEERLRFRQNRVREAVEKGRDPLAQEVLRPPTRRELALQRRMALEPSSPFGTTRPYDDDEEEEEGEEGEEEEEFLMVEGERGGFGGRRLLSAPTDGPSDWLARLRPGTVMERVGRKWVQGVLEVWFFLQLIVVAMVFMKEAMKMGRKPRRAALGQQQQQRRIA
ncbi:hypothetical protein BDY24DRAFT_75022 [Mrakia frigida]|uniref:uncharacterized protein n=1 Tax=Mrakia frigida TaxID=29902 RepID=UPI003FCC11C8